MGANHPLRLLDALEQEGQANAGYTGTARWMIPYADLLTLLLGFFMMLFAITHMENMELKEKTQTLDPAKAAQYKNAVSQEKIAAQLAQSPEAAVRAFEADLLKQLSLTGQQVSVRQDTRGLVISFQEQIFFEPGKAHLTPATEKTLDKLAGMLQQTEHPIRIEGHTDNTPIKTAQFPSNWELSTARATTIVRYFIEKHHFPPNRLSAAGYGEFYPLANNSTIKGKQKNRRVDIVLLNPLSGLATEKPNAQIRPHSQEE